MKYFFEKERSWTKREDCLEEGNWLLWHEISIKKTNIYNALQFFLYFQNHFVEIQN